MNTLEGTQQPEPKHCGHECRCIDYINGIKMRSQNRGDPCKWIPCVDDTCARGPVPAEQPIPEYNPPLCLGMLDCPDIKRSACNYLDDCARTKEHDALIAAREWILMRLEFLKVLNKIKWAVGNIDDIPEDCKVHSDGDYHPSCESKRCVDCIIDNAIESLRAQPEQSPLKSQCPVGGCENESECPKACSVNHADKQRFIQFADSQFKPPESKEMR